MHMLFFSKKKKGKRKHSFSRYLAWTSPAIAFSFIIVLYVIVEYKIFSISTIFETIWFTIVTTTTTGYGDIVPKTFGGRIIAVGFMLFGVGAVSIFTGAVSSFLINEKIITQKKIRRLAKMKKHTLILGYKEDLHLLINDILSYEKRMYTDDIILINDMDSDKMDKLLSSHGLNGVAHIKGDFSDETTLLNSGIKKAKKAIILANRHSSDDYENIDAKTAVVFMILRSLNPNIYICAEVLTLKYKNHLTKLKCDEVIHGSQYTRFLIANAASYSGITSVVDKLLDIGESALLSLMPVDKNIVGRNFKSVFDDYKMNKNKIVIGIVENMGLERDLKKEAIMEAQKTPDISELVKNLKEVKYIEKNNAVINPKDNYIIKKHSALIIINSMER